jgi:MFS family permease
MQPAAGSEDGVWAPSLRPLTFGLVLAVTLVGFEALAIATVMPSVKDDLGGLGLYGWAFSAFFLGSILGIVAAGRDADRSGPARPFAVGLLLFGGGLLVGGLAPSMVVLVGARAVQGMGAGAIPAVAYSVIGRAYRVDLQPRMFAILSSAWVLPAIIGPALAGAVADTIGWRWVFLGLLPLVALNGLSTVPALARMGPPGGGEPVDRRRDALVLTLGAGLVLGGVSARSAFTIVPLIIVGAVLGVRAFVKLMPVGTTRLAPGMPAAVAIRGVIAFAFFGTDAFVSLALTDLHDASASLAGIALTAAALFWTAGAWVQERRVKQVGPRAFVRGGLFVVAAGIGGMVIVAQYDVPIAFAVLAWSLGGLGMGLAYAPLSLIVLGEAPEGSEGTASAALNLCETLGVALGTGVTGAIVAAGDTLEWDDATALTLAFTFCGLIALVATLATRRLPRAVATPSSP